MNAFLFDSLVVRIGWTLVHSMWEGVAIAVILLIALRLLRASSSSARYLVCCGAMVLVVATIVGTFVFMGAVPEMKAAPLAPFPRPELGKPQFAEPLANSLAVSQRTATTKDQLILRTLVLGWMLGVLVLSVRQLGGWIYLSRLRHGRLLDEQRSVARRLSQRLGIARVVDILECARLDVLAVIGVLRPVILIPIGVLNDLTPRQVEAILAHELAHVRRHDYLVNLIQTAIEVLMFYHPAVWWMSSRIRAERENCCDDIAAEICGDRRVYAQALTALEARRNRASLALAATDGSLLYRVRRLLRLPPARQPYRVRSILAAALATACIAAPVIALAQQRDKSTTPTPTTSATTLPSSLRAYQLIDLGEATIAATQPASVAGQPVSGTITLMLTDSTAVKTTTQPAIQLKTFKVVIGRESIFHEGQRTNWTAVELALRNVTEAQRRQTVLEIAAASGDLTIKTFNEAKSHANRLVQLYGLAYLSDTGIDPTLEPLPNPPAAPAKPAPTPAATQPGAEFRTLQDERRKIAAADQRLAQTFGSAHPQRQHLQAILQALDARMADLSRTPAFIDVPLDKASPELINLLNIRARLEEQMARLSQSLGPKHPLFKTVVEHLKRVNKKIDEIVGVPVI